MTDTQAKTLLLKQPIADNNMPLVHARPLLFYQAKGQQLTTVRSLGARMAKNSYRCVTALKIIFLSIFIFSFLLTSILRS